MFPLFMYMYVACLMAKRRSCVILIEFSGPPRYSVSHEASLHGGFSFSDMSASVACCLLNILPGLYMNGFFND